MKKSTTRPKASPASLWGDDEDRRRTAAQLHEQLLKACADENSDPAKIGMMIEKLREALGVSIDEFCSAAKISPTTYHRWTKDTKSRPPIHRIEFLSKLLAPKKPEEQTRDSIFIGDNRVTLRTWEQVLDRETYCKKFWTFKHAVPYRAGMLGDVYHDVAMLLSTRKATMHCVFLGPDDIWEQNDALLAATSDPFASGQAMLSKWPALDSFASLKKTLYKADAVAANEHLKGWLVSDERLAFELGLSIHYLGVTILEYDTKEVANHQSLAGREVDILFEIPNAVYKRDNHSRLVAGTEEIRWLELNPDSSRWLFRNRLKAKLDALEAKKLPGAVEFLSSESEAERYQERTWFPMGMRV